MLFDVPLFFFLTGCLLNFKPDLDPFKQIAKTIVLFFVPVVIINLISGYCALKNILQPVFLSGADIKLLPAVNGSYWFMPVYIVGLIYSLIIVRFLNKFWQGFILVAIPLYYVYSWFSSKILDVNILGVSAQLELFYIWVILLGFSTFKVQNKIIPVLFILIGSISYVVMNFTIEGFSLQDYKFIVHLPYVLASLFSIGLIMIFKNALKNSFLEHIGSKALYFYLSQGIGTSVLLTIAGHIKFYWVIKLTLCYFINLVISLGLGELFSKVPCIFEKFKKIFKKKLLNN